MTEENPHKVLLWERIHNGPTDFSLECQAEGCNWKIPTTPEYEDGARMAAKEHIDMWNLRQANAGHAALIAKLGEEKAELIEALAAGDASDGYHTHNQLYDHRRLLTLHAVHAWLAAGYRVVKSWNHSDGEPAFGGGWFIIVARLPQGRQVSYHYEAEHWRLFDIPEADNAPEYDGHSADDVVTRLSQSSYEYADDMTALARDSAILNALNAGGVDNWQGYEIALEEMSNDETQ